MAKSPEQRLESRQIREMRKQIIRLKRQNAQLRKQNSRIANDFSDFEEEDAYESLEAGAPEADKPQIPCPKCESTEIITLELRKLPYYLCRDCGSKGQLHK